MFTIQELIDVVIMSIGIGFILMNYVPNINKKDNFGRLNLPYKLQKGFDWEKLKYSIILTAPSVIIHELGHKLVALSYGLEATFHAAYTWLGIGVVLRLLNFGFIFFVPGYVEVRGIATPLEHSIIAIAGPLAHLIIFGVAWYLTNKVKLSKNQFIAWKFIQRINLILMIFNMLPIPGFDGWAVYRGLWQTIF